MNASDECKIAGFNGGNVMDETDYKPGIGYYVVVWGGLSVLAALQGWMTGDSVRVVLGWLGH